MKNLAKKRFEILRKLRWIARITSVLFIFGLIVIFFGDQYENSEIRSHEWLGVLYFPVGFVAGLIIGWKNDLIGGLISVLCLWIFYFVYSLKYTGQIPPIISFLIFSVPAILFLVAGTYAYFAIGKLADKSN